MMQEQLDAIRERRIKATGIAIRETKGEAFRAIQLSLLDIPALLDEVERLRKRCEAAVGDLRAMEKDAMCKVCKSKCNYSPSHFAGCGLFEWRGQEGAEAALKEELK
jgi:hypothetical protein